jgi:hypothetical protein
LPIESILTPPDYCEYAAGPCDQDFTGIHSTAGLFLYSSHSAQIAGTIEGAVALLRQRESGRIWQSWRDFPIAGQIIFCTVCKGMRGAECIIADVTTLNFNLLFEIGFAVGLGRSVIPIRDTTFITDQNAFRELGLLDTIGYLDFQNSDTLATGVAARLPVEPLSVVNAGVRTDAPLYVLKGHIPTEGDVRLMSTLRKSAVQFRVFDPIETPRLSLHEASRQIAGSLGVVAHLLSPNRTGAIVHNARCALLAGIALATGKTLLLLQEDVVQQPIDYRDIVVSYKTPAQVPALLEPFLRDIIALLQDPHAGRPRTPAGFLEQLDIGDIAAENELVTLKSYFVRTSQFNEAKRGTARLVVGRKGAGKTALFYGVRDSLPKGHSNLVLDLKPEGHQFTKLREAVLSHLTLGLQEHTLTAFWNYILLCEMAAKIREQDYSWAQRDPERWTRFSRVVEVYERQVASETGDFSERLLRQVERLTERFKLGDEPPTGGELTEMLFRGEIRALDDVLAPYLEEKDAVWVLVDNLDKGWPTRGARTTDILILRELMEATRKLQRQFEQRGVGFHCLVFLRNDIYDHLLLDTPDRGKDTPISLDWDDAEVFKEMLRQRIAVSTGARQPFDEVWPKVIDPYIGTRETFGYMVERTLMRPRDLLAFFRRAIGVAVNRGHDRIAQEDVLLAEQGYSEDLLLNTAFELHDIYPEMIDVLYMFERAPVTLSEAQVLDLVRESGGAEGPTDELLELLLWFGFLGVRDHGSETPTYSYQVRYNIEKLRTPIRRGRASYVIHPAFHRALSCVGEI